ncbi:MAG: hypothetical protein QNJ54_30535 [Prochloraceae cyanobacterium]|nr:hypothetical protein [Prochloraceae cyanobacterium]
MSFLTFVGTSLKFLDGRAGYNLEVISQNTHQMGNYKEYRKQASCERLEEILTTDDRGVCDLAKYF